LLDLVIKVKGIKEDEAITWLAGLIGDIAYDDFSFRKKVEHWLTFSHETANKYTIPYYNKNILTPWVSNDTDFFEDRGISQETREVLSLGYDPHHVRYNRLTKSDHIGPAIIIPAFFKGVLVGYQERWLDKPEGFPRYTNTSDFPKSEILYGYDYLSTFYTSNNIVVIVESPLTAAYLIGLGYLALATYGASVTPEQFALIRGLNRVYLSFDNDQAGEKALKDGIRALNHSCDLYIVDPVDLEKGDLNDLGMKKGEEAVRNHIRAANSYLMYIAKEKSWLS
jgi:hypothetical protein